VPGNGSNDKPTLLVADDDEGVLYLLADCLRREGYAVVEFDGGEKALEWLTHHNADLLVLDLKLGDLPAPSLIERLRQLGRDFPFIVVTGHGDERSAVEVMKQGALDYVMKDTGMLDLLPGIIRRVMGIIERDRKLAEANAIVRQREERLQKIIQTAFDGFIRFDSKWRILDANRAFCEMVGYSREELLSNGPSIFECGLAPDDFEQRMADLQKAGSAHYFTSLNRGNGPQYEVEVSIRADADEYIGFVHDLSELRRLERMMLQSTLNERRRVGSELHDGLGQQLTAIELMSHALARELKQIAPAQAGSAAKITKYIQDAVTLTRQLAHGLAPIAEEENGLLVALADLASMTTAAGVACKFSCDPQVAITDTTVAGHLYRIAQEAVTNSLKHGKARDIHLRLEDQGTKVELSIEDNGRGLPEKPPQTPGMGLQLIQHRARLIGGQVTVHSIRGRGVRVVCSLPKQS
jgi:two-component system sensor kinase FixL